MRQYDQMRKAKDALIRQKSAEIERLRADIYQLKKPSAYWDDRNLESTYDDIEEGVGYDDVGDIIPLRPLHELPTVFVLVGIDRDTHREFHTREAAEAARGK